MKNISEHKTYTVELSIVELRALYNLLMEQPKQYTTYSGVAKRLKKQISNSLNS